MNFSFDVDKPLGLSVWARSCSICQRLTSRKILRMSPLANRSGRSEVCQCEVCVGGMQVHWSWELVLKKSSERLDITFFPLEWGKNARLIFQCVAAGLRCVSASRYSCKRSFHRNRVLQLLSHAATC